MHDPIQHQLVKVPCLMLLTLALIAATSHAQPAPVGDVMTLQELDIVYRDEVTLTDMEFLGNGNFVIVWEEDRLGLEEPVLKFAVYNHDGTPVSGPIHFADGYRPRVAAASSSFMVVWDAPGPWNDVSEVFCRRFDQTGTPASATASVTPSWTFPQYNADVSFDGSDFHVAWTLRVSTSRYEVRYRLVSPDGELLTDSIWIDNGGSPRIVALSPSVAEIVYGRSGLLGLWGRQVDSDDGSLSEPFTLDEQGSSTTGYYGGVEVGRDVLDAWTAVWLGYHDSVSGVALIARKFSSSDLALTDEIAVGPARVRQGEGSTCDTDQLADRRWIAAWEEPEGGGLVAMLTADGTPFGVPGMLPPSEVVNPRIRSRFGDEFLVVWIDTTEDSEAIRGQRYLFRFPSAFGFDAEQFVGREDSGSATVTVTRGGDLSHPVTVDWATRPGTADENVDFQTSTGSLSWPAGDATPRSFQVTLYNDSDAEGFESFYVDLKNPYGGEIMTDARSAEVLIDDDDIASVELAAGEVTVPEAGGSVELLVLRRGRSTDAVQVSWATANGSASAGSDYLSGSGTLSWGAGDTTPKTITLVIQQDSVFEIDETFSVALSSPSTGAILGLTSTAVVSILDDDHSVLSFDSPSTTAVEQSGIATATVVRTGLTTGSVSVQVGTVAGTATADEDFVPLSETLSWGSGDATPRQVQVTLLPDQVLDAGETFRIVLSSPGGAARVGATSEVEVELADDWAEVGFFSTTQTGYEIGEPVGIRLQRRGSASQPVSVWVQSVGGTATPGADFTAISEQVTWSPGDPELKVVDLEIHDDALFEGTESLLLQITGPQGSCSLGTNTTMQISIADDEASELWVNQHTDEQQTRPTAGSSAAGESVVGWDTYLQDGSGWGVAFRRYAGDGTPLGDEMLANVTTSGDQRDVRLDVAPDGRFVVVWAGYGADGSGWGIVARRFAADGTPVGGEIVVNTATGGDQVRPDVAIDDAGRFMVVWERSDLNEQAVYGRVFAWDGTPLSAGAQLHAATTDARRYPRVDAFSTLGFVTVWQATGSDGPSEGIVARRFGPSGSALAPETVVNAYTSGVQERPDVACTGDDRFTVVWQDGNHRDGSGDSVWLRHFASSGGALGGDVRVNEYWLGDQELPSVSTDSTGNALVTWESDGQDGSGDGIFGRSVDANGWLYGREMQFNSFVIGSQHHPTVTISPSSTFSVVWASGAEDGSGDGVFAVMGAFEGSSLIFRDGFESGDTGAW